MNPRIAEQLLYDSEATLRLVDTLLDELQVMEPKLHEFHGELQLCTERSLEELSDLPDLLIAAAGQARAVLDGLAQSRDVLERTSQEKLGDSSAEHREAPSAFEIRGGLERALLLVDRLEHESNPGPVRDLLRDEILEMLHGVRSQEITEQQLTYASSVLRDTEARLSALVQCLSPRQPVIRFPGAFPPVRVTG